jgi:hypothetical protein
VSLEEKLGQFGNWLDKNAEKARTIAGKAANELSERAARLYGYVEAEAELGGLSADDVIERVNAYQSSDIVHPLTCGTQSTHEKLRPVKTDPDNRVVLVCPTCNYVQTNIPREVLLAYSMLQEAQQAIRDEGED